MQHVLTDPGEFLVTVGVVAVSWRVAVLPGRGRSCWLLVGVSAWAAVQLGMLAGSGEPLLAVSGGLSGVAVQSG